MLDLRPPGLGFQIMCLEDSVISFISPSSGGYQAQFSLYVHKGGLKPDSFHFVGDIVKILRSRLLLKFKNFKSFFKSCYNLECSCLFVNVKDLDVWHYSVHVYNIEYYFIINP